jgi:hypothetical protein
MVSFDVDTAAPDDEPFLPVAAIALVAEFFTAASARAAVVSLVLVDDPPAPVDPVAEVDAVDVAPDVVVDCVDAEPLAVPPDVLM